MNKKKRNVILLTITIVAIVAAVITAYVVVVENQKKEAKFIDSSISKIEVEKVTPADEKEIKNCREMYNNANKSVKEKVKKEKDLKKLESKLSEVSASVKKTETDISNIGFDKNKEAENFGLTLESKEKVTNARAAYDSLDKSLQEFVSNVDELTKSEETIAKLEKEEQERIEAEKKEEERKAAQKKSTSSNSGKTSANNQGGLQTFDIFGTPITASSFDEAMVEYKRRQDEIFANAPTDLGERAAYFDSLGINHGLCQNPITGEWEHKDVFIE